MTTTIFPKTRALLSRTPPAAASVPSIPIVQAAAKNANTNALNSALTKYVKSIRNLRGNTGIKQTNLLTKIREPSRAQINEALANYVMAVNSAKYLNDAAVNTANAATQANNRVAKLRSLLNTYNNKYVSWYNSQSQSNLNSRSTNLTNASKNVILNNSNIYSQKMRTVRMLIANAKARKAQQQIAPLNASLNAPLNAPLNANATARKAQQQIAPLNAPLIEMKIKAPNKRLITVVRTGNKPWNFKNSNNEQNYTLTNRGKNKPMLIPRNYTKAFTNLT